MTTNNEVLEFAYLMDKTGYTYLDIFYYTKAQDAYCSQLDDDENVDSEMMFEFIEQHTNLSHNKISKIGDLQLAFLKEDISNEEQVHLVEKMYHRFTDKDRERISPDFYRDVLDYIQY